MHKNASIIISIKQQSINNEHLCDKKITSLTQWKV